MGLLHTHRPAVRPSANRPPCETICCMRNVLPVHIGPASVTSEIGGASVRRKAAASACSTILPKELMEMSWMALLLYF